MAVNLDTIAEKIMKFIRGNGLDVKMFDSESGKSVADPATARFFYIDEPNMMIVLDENEGTIKFHMGEDVSIKHPMISKMHKNLKSMATDHMLDFDIRSFGKRIEPKGYGYKIEQNKERDVDEVYESISPLEGSSRTSRQQLENAKIIVRHKKPVNEEVRGARSRDISAIFIENADGERFKYPYKHLSGARAMARHISTGGNPMDMAGSAIIEMSENLYKLKEFMNIVNKQRLVNETNRDVVLNVKRKMKKIKEQISHIQGAKGYTSFIESLALNEKDDEKMVCKDCGDEMGKPTTDCKHDCNDPNGSHWVKKSDISEEVLNDYVAKFTKSTFEETLKDILPLVHRVNEEEYNTNRDNQIEKIMGIITAKDADGNKVNKITFPNRGSYDFANIKKQYQKDKGSQYAKLAGAYEDLASRVDVDAADDKVRKNKGHDRAAIISLFLADIAEKLNSNPKSINKQEQQLASYFMKMSKVAVGESLEEKKSLDDKISNMVNETFSKFDAVFYEYQIDEGRMKDSVIHDSETMSKEEFAKKHGKDYAAVMDNEPEVEEVNEMSELNHKTHVMASPAGSSDVYLWKNVDGKATIVKRNLSTVEAGKLQKDHGVKWVRYGAQKYFNDLMKNEEVELDERKLTGGEKRSKEANFKKLKKHKGDFEKTYGKDAESVMHAVATKRAKGE